MTLARDPEVPVLTPELLARMDTPGPRYTSYPTADRFVEAFGPEQAADALSLRAQSSLAGGSQPLSLYVHVPFCESLCYYCACNKVITRHHERAGEYLAAPAGVGGQGHFGLAVNDYAHSTAPNRRYPDLVTQRLLKAAMAGAPPPYSAEDLGAITRHCTLQEDNASKVEREVLKAAGAWLLQGRIGEVFDAIVTGAAPKGTYVRIARPLLEGRVVRGFEGLDVGDKLRVRLVAVDGLKSHIDFEAAT